MAPKEWLQIDIAQAGSELRATARGSRGEEPLPHLLGPHLPPEVIRQFGEWVKEAALSHAPLMPLAQAQQLYQALFREGLQEVLSQLRGAAGGSPILLRLNPADPELHAVPWEALCRPDTTVGFLGTSPELCLVRGANATKPWAPCKVEGAVRVLVISPSDERAPERLREVLQPSIEAGELEWLPPLAGSHARKAYVLQRLRYKPVPHIIHFIGHGGLDEAGNPTLRLANKDGEPSWLKVELLAKELENLFRDELRLIVLEACEGAQPGALSSAAALLAEAGAGAVVAHLWPVRADVARSCSASFYASLTGTATHQGDVARSLQDARRTVLADFDESAEAFSPVLYLRGHDSVLFDFQGRKLLPQRPATQAATNGDRSKPSGTDSSGTRPHLANRVQAHHSQGHKPFGVVLARFMKQKFAVAFGGVLVASVLGFWLVTQMAPPRQRTGMDEYVNPRLSPTPDKPKGSSAQLPKAPADIFTECQKSVAKSMESMPKSPDEIVAEALFRRGYGREGYKQVSVIRGASLARQCLRDMKCLDDKSCSGRYVEYANQVLDAYGIVVRTSGQDDKERVVLRNLQRQAHEMFALFLWDESRRMRFAATNAFFNDFPEAGNESVELRKNWERETSSQKAEQWRNGMLFYAKKRSRILSVWCSSASFCDVLKGRQFLDLGCVEAGEMRSFQKLVQVHGGIKDLSGDESLVLEPEEMLCTRNGGAFLAVAFSEE